MSVRRHARRVNHHKESSLEEGYISSDIKNQMNKNERLVVGILIVGIVLFLGLSIALFLRQTGGNISRLAPTLTVSPTKNPNLTPYPTVPPIKNMTVLINEIRFNPSSTSIPKGGFVDFMNIGQNDITIEANDTASTILNIGSIAPNEDKQVVFNTSGTYTYINKDNPKEIGTITVK